MMRKIMNLVIMLLVIGSFLWIQACRELDYNENGGAGEMNPFSLKADIARHDTIDITHFTQLQKANHAIKRVNLEFALFASQTSDADDEWRTEVDVLTQNLTKAQLRRRKALEKNLVEAKEKVKVHVPPDEGFDNEEEYEIYVIEHAKLLREMKEIEETIIADEKEAKQRAAARAEVEAISRKRIKINKNKKKRGNKNNIKEQEETEIIKEESIVEKNDLPGVLKSIARERINRAKKARKQLEKDYERLAMYDARMDKRRQQLEKDLLFLASLEKVLNEKRKIISENNMYLFGKNKKKLIKNKTEVIDKNSK